MGSEAMELVFWRALTVDDLKQVIIIADAPCNSQAETIAKRNSSFKEAYWKGTKFS